MIYLVLELSPIKETKYAWNTFYKRSILLYNSLNKRNAVFHKEILSATSTTDLAIETYNHLGRILNAAEADLYSEGDIETDCELMQFVYDKKTNGFHKLERYWL